MDMNLYEYTKINKLIPPGIVAHIVYQILLGVYHMHANGIYHRDIKPENILLSGNKIKLADFGSVHSMHGNPPFTEYISTRWYRSPECLITDGYYNCYMDIWGIGCVFFELMTLYPLFPGQ